MKRVVPISVVLVILLISSCSGINSIGVIPKTTAECYDIYTVGAFISTQMLACAQDGKVVAATGGVGQGVVGATATGAGVALGAWTLGSQVGDALGGHVIRELEKK